LRKHQRHIATREYAVRPLHVYLIQPLKPGVTPLKKTVARKSS